MAQALHEITGLPIRCIDYGPLVHAFVVTENNEAIDIHGVHPWDEYIALLVAQRALPSHANAGVVQQLEMPDEPPISWRDMGYKKPTRSAISKAKDVVARHPNLRAVANGTWTHHTDAQCADDLQESYARHRPG